MTSRVVVITGAQGGIGAELVRAFTATGDTVESLDLVEGFDVSDRAACDAEIDRILRDRGRVDVLCNNAGIGASGDVLCTTAEEWRRVFDVNVIGAANMTAAVLPSMRAARRGAIVNTCSIVASVGFVDRVVYSASKGALLAMTRAIAADEAARGIRVNAVSPATVDGPWVRRNAEASGDSERFLTAMRRRQPLEELISPAEVARAVLFLADRDSQLTAVNLPVDGGSLGVRLIDLPANG